MALEPQRRARRYFWWALLSLPVTVAAFFAALALQDDFSEAWLAWIMVDLAIIFLLGFIFVVWSLLFRRSRTGFPRWSIALGLLGLLLVPAVVLAPFIGFSARSSPPSRGAHLPPPRDLRRTRRSTT